MRYILRYESSDVVRVSGKTLYNLYYVEHKKDHVAFMS